MIPVRRSLAVRARTHAGALLRPVTSERPELATRLADATRTRSGRVALVAAAVVVAWVILGALLPSGLPFGVIVLGLVLGGLYALTAMGLVLIYRSSRIINFAQVEIGGLAATVAQVMVRGWHQSYFLAVPIGLAVALGTGALIDRVVVRRFFNAPRLILTVATIGVLQILGAAEIRIPTLVSGGAGEGR